MNSKYWRITRRISNLPCSPALDLYGVSKDGVPYENAGHGAQQDKIV